jgi:hypothetical protein
MASGQLWKHTDNNSEKEATKDVEIYVGYTNHTWDTIFISIPLSILEDEMKIKKIAKIKIIDLFYNSPNTREEVAFIGVYNIPDIC